MHFTSAVHNASSNIVHFFTRDKSAHLSTDQPFFEFYKMIIGHGDYSSSTEFADICKVNQFKVIF